MNHAAIVTVVVLLAVAALLGWSYGWERKLCPRCKGSGRGRWSRDSAFNRDCGRCGGDGYLIRPLSLIWPKHREQARRRREARRR